jgi:hypothetical protein
MKATLSMNGPETGNTSEPTKTLSTVAPIAPVLVRKNELARRLSVSPRTIEEWSRKRLIPYIHAGNRFYLYEFDAVLAALKKHYQIEAVTR